MIGPTHDGQHMTSPDKSISKVLATSTVPAANTFKALTQDNVSSTGSGTATANGIYAVTKGTRALDNELKAIHAILTTPPIFMDKLANLKAELEETCDMTNTVRRALWTKMTKKFGEYEETLQSILGTT
jgi:hypothetical protein